MKLNIGDTAPSFNTFDSDKQVLNSESLKGKKSNNIVYKTTIVPMEQMVAKGEVTSDGKSKSSPTIEKKLRGKASCVL